MKKKTALIAGLLIISVAIIILSFYWPPVDDNDVAGTFAKTEKYKDDNVNKDDIILDSKILQDSVKVNKLISDLVQFGEFAQYLKAVLNQFWLKELEKTKSVPEINSAISQIKDFNNFIDNNNQIIQGTIIKFVDYNFTDKKQLDDIESQLKQLQNYVAQFLARDSLFEFTIRNVDLVIKNRLVKQDQINNLKNLRDKFVIDQFMYGLKIGDTVKVSQAISQDFYNPQKSLKQFDLSFSDRVNNAELGAINSYWGNIVKILIPAGYNQNQLNVIANSLNLVGIIGNSNGGNGGAGGEGGFYAKDTYFSFNQESLGLIVNQEKLNAAMNTEKLNAAMNTEKLNAAMNTEKLNSASNNFNLGLIINTDNLRLASFDNANQNVIFNDPSTLKLFNEVSLGMFSANGPIFNLIFQNNILGDDN